MVSMVGVRLWYSESLFSSELKTFPLDHSEPILILKSYIAAVNHIAMMVDPDDYPESWSLHFSVSVAEIEQLQNKFDINSIRSCK